MFDVPLSGKKRLATGGTVAERYDMTAASGDQLPPEENEQLGRNTQAGTTVPNARGEFLAATRQLMRGSRAFITGGDAGIGRVIAVGLAREGVDVAIAYSPDEPAEDAARTATLVEQEGRRCVTMRGDLADEDTCRDAMNHAVAELGGIDILVNVTALQSTAGDLQGLDDQRWERSFRTNVFSFFMATRRPLAHLRRRKGRRKHLGEELILKNF
ncbi:MAG TPA: SDR family NAD(P)-dependent oxidoreductase [Streptosporangiaceae bacterium]|nr:SDR family NAD(P)-dependent oxidoreductase [Streptosporangiaceae bacterium]